MENRKLYVEQERIPRRIKSFALSVLRWIETFIDDRAIELFDGDALGSEISALVNRSIGCDGSPFPLSSLPSFDEGLDPVARL